MKIKRQITLLISGIIIIPLLSVFIISMILFWDSSKKTMIEEFNQVRIKNEGNLPFEDWENLNSFISRLPNKVEIVIVFKNNIIFSNMKGFENNDNVFLKNIFTLVRETSDKFNYHFESITFSKDDQNTTGYIFSRLPVRKVNHRPKPATFIRYIAITLAILEITAVCIIIHISKNISNSIVFLKSKTDQIAIGNLESEITNPGKGSNEISQLAENLEKMRKSLRYNEERRNKFLMGMSHDLRTPVALIKGYTEAIIDGIVHGEDKVRESALLINSKTEQLENLITDMINYIKLENQPLEQNLIKTSLREYINQQAIQMESASQLYKRNFKYSIDIDEKTVIMLDQTMYIRTIENLFSNALRYTKENDTITFTATESEQDISISMEDTGMGISEKDKNHIFELLYRGTNSRREEGFGIGLSVVKSIADTHGWTIDVESKLNVGTKFTIRIRKSQ